MKKERGVTLIMVAAVLAVLAAMATGFYVMVLMEAKSAIRYADSVRADMVAHAGIHYAINQLRHEAFLRTEDPGSAWYQVDYLRGAAKRVSFPDSELLHNGSDDDNDDAKEKDNPEEAFVQPDKMRGYSMAMGSSASPESDRFTLNIADAAGKININAGDNLAVMLDNLCRAIGPPLVAANLDALQPRRWAIEAGAGDPVRLLYTNALNQDDTSTNRDLYYTMTDEGGAVLTNGLGRPKRGPDGIAIYGDGYAMAGYRGRHGAYQSLEDVKNALTYVERNGNSTADDPLERLEIEVKFAAIRDYITTSSWVDTNTVCVGKFEWINFVSGGSAKTYAIDREKSWVVDDLSNDPLNVRGSLRGCYLSIINGHGAGQLRRIRTNGIDWVEVESGFAVTPGPISSYMIISNEEAMLVDVNGQNVTQSYPDNPPPLGKLTFPKTKPNGTLVPNPKLDYSLHPLCIHRAPVNVNTASDKVLVSLLLGINVQHGHPLAVGTDTDVDLVRAKWKMDDVHGVEPYVLTSAGLKRLPATSGKMVLNRLWDSNPIKKQVVPPPAATGYDVAYLNNYDLLGEPSYAYQTVNGKKIIGTMTEAHELAYRIIMARQNDRLQPALKFIEPDTGVPTSSSMSAGRKNIPRGVFRTYDDLYFRVIKPWDDMRFKRGWVDTNASGKPDAGDVFHNAKLAPMIMANFNSNLDVLKFNPNIEWIDRWGRNFTSLEPVMIYTDQQPPALPVPNWQSYWGAQPTQPVHWQDVPAADPVTPASVPIYSCVPDPDAKGWGGRQSPPLASGQQDNAGNFIWGAYLTRSFRYKSDEMIDKTDMNRSTTEFSFDSNGVFEITSAGQVVRGSEVLAERKYYALTKVYDVWRESMQSQFVQGTISKAYGDRGSPCSGQLARDASGLVERKGLVTLPEPLLPLTTRIVDAKGNRNAKNLELVSAVGTGDNSPLDAFGRPRRNPYDSGANPIDVPEVLANHILPARYDGQIALATNTSDYDPSISQDADTFLASFDGDLDTATCLGNGREQAKWPYSAVPDGTGSYRYTGEGYKHRCVQGIGLLGLLNDTLVASDPGLPLVKSSAAQPYKAFNSFADKPNVRRSYPFFGISPALMPLRLGPDLERPYYWNNVTLRMGSLRTDGAYLSGPGVSGNNATLKYPYTPLSANRHTKLNFQPDSKDANCVTMWAKTAWHHDDRRNHEFFNPGNEARVDQCAGQVLQKMGQYKYSSEMTSPGGAQCGNRRELNDLYNMMAYQNGSGYVSIIHGGSAGVVNANTLPQPESAGYYVQPFRWSYVGYRLHYRTTEFISEGQGPHGHWVGSADWGSTSLNEISRYYARPVVDTALYPESEANWSGGTSAYAVRLRWAYHGYLPVNDGSPNTYGDARDVVGGGTAPVDPSAGGRYGEGQDAKWAWADPYGQLAKDPYKLGYSPKTFGMNNLNYGNPIYNQPFDEKNGAGSCALLWHYRQMPEDGTYAVIDEFKISNRDRVMVDDRVGGMSPDWKKDRVVREMQTSRYYLPPKPGGRQPPSAGGPPTFTSQTLLQSRKGFDKLKDSQQVAVVRVSWNVFTPRFMCEYQAPGIGPFNSDKYLSRFASTTAPQAKVAVPIKGPFDYEKYNDDSDQGLDANPKGTAYGVNRPAPWNYVPGLEQSNRGVEIELLEDQGSGTTVLANKTFTDPAGLNALSTPETAVMATASNLRYRVRFMYPVDALCDPTGGQAWQGKKFVDGTKQYALDTPVFDDISITFATPFRMLAFRALGE